MRVRTRPIFALGWTGLMAVVLVGLSAAADAAPDHSFLDAASSIVAMCLLLGWVFVLIIILMSADHPDTEPRLRDAVSPARWRPSTWAAILWTGFFIPGLVSVIKPEGDSAAVDGAAGYTILYSAVLWPIGLVMVVIARARSDSRNRVAPGAAAGPAEPSASSEQSDTWQTSSMAADRKD